MDATSVQIYHGNIQIFNLFSKSKVWIHSSHLCEVSNDELVLELSLVLLRYTSLHFFDLLLHLLFISCNHNYVEAHLCVLFA